MARWDQVDIDRDGTGDAYNKWDDDFVNDLEIRFNRLRGFDETLNESTNEDTIERTEKTKYALKHDTIELVANQVYDKLITMFNNDRKRSGIQKGELLLNPIRRYENFKLADDGELTYIYKRMAIDLGNINERLKAPWEILRIGVSKLKSMGFLNKSEREDYKVR